MENTQITNATVFEKNKQLIMIERTDCRGNWLATNLQTGLKELMDWKHFTNEFHGCNVVLKAADHAGYREYLNELKEFLKTV